MKLRFYPRKGHCARFPGLKTIGQASARPGWIQTPVGDQDAGIGSKLECCKDAFEVDSDTKDGKRIAKLCRRDGSFYPADPQTAKFCGVAMVDVEHTEDGFVPKKTVLKKGDK